MLHVSSNRRLAADVTGHGEVARPANSGDGRSHGRVRWNTRSRARTMVVVAGADAGCSGTGDELGGGDARARSGRGAAAC